jgi:hypothetical protein
MKSSDVLLKLICACVDDERTLHHERRFVDPERAGTLDGLARERQQFVTDLEPFVGPGKFRWDGSWAELLRETGRNVQVAAAGRNSGDAVATCRHSRSRTEACYDDALRRQWPPEIRGVLEAQLRRLQNETDLLNRLQF